MQLNQLKRTHKNKQGVRIGRGGKRGKTSGRGHKGQRAHGGHGIRPEMRDIIKKLPKKRGYGKNRARTVVALINKKPMAINLQDLDTTFADGDIVSLKTLNVKRLIGKRTMRVRGVKILGRGLLSKKLTIRGCGVSTKAREAIVKVGGLVK